MHPNTTRSQQHTAPSRLDPILVRDDLSQLLALLGVRTQLQVAHFGPHPAIGFSPLWLPDAQKLAVALKGVRAEALPRRQRGGEGGVMDPANCVHLGVGTGQTCPNCGHVVGEPAPAPQKYAAAAW